MILSVWIYCLFAWSKVTVYIHIHHIHIYVYIQLIIEGVSRSIEYMINMINIYVRFCHTLVSDKFPMRLIECWRILWLRLFFFVSFSCNFWAGVLQVRWTFIFHKLQGYRWRIGKTVNWADYLLFSQTAYIWNELNKGWELISCDLLIPCIKQNWKRRQKKFQHHFRWVQYPI